MGQKEGREMDGTVATDEIVDVLANGFIHMRSVTARRRIFQHALSLVLTMIICHHLCYAAY